MAQGLRALIFLIVLCAQGLAASCCPPGDQNCLTPYHGIRVAFLVGVDAYGGNTQSVDRLNDLVNAVNDVVAIAEQLTAKNYSVRCLINPKIDEFIAERKVLENHLSTIAAMPPDDLEGNSVVVHFSGHGFRVGPADYVFFSGDYAKADYPKNSIRVGDILNKFDSFSNLNIIFVIDACRNTDSAHPNWMDGTFGPANSYSQTKNDSHVLVFSTKANKLAHDVSLDIGANANGAFVFVLKKYLQFVFLDLPTIYQLVGEDSDMQKIAQIPDILPAALNRTEAAWAAPGDCGTCCLYGRSSVVEFGACSGPLNAANSCHNACAQFQLFEQSAANNQFCPRHVIVDVYSKAQTCGPATQPIRDLLRIVSLTPTPTAAAADVANLRKSLQLNLARSRSTAIAVTPSPGGATTTVPDLVDQIQNATPNTAMESRNAILRATRSAAGPNGSFSPVANLSFKLPTGPIELQLIPGPAGGTTGVFQPVAPPKVDCLTQYCDPNWVMVRAPIAKDKFIDGWLQSNKVAAAPASETAQIAFAGTSVQPTKEGFAALQKFIDIAKQNPQAPVSVIAVTQPNDDDRLRAGARIIRVRSLLTGPAVGEQRINTQIVEVANTDDFAAVTVELIK